MDVIEGGDRKPEVRGEGDSIKATSVVAVFSFFKQNHTEVDYRDIFLIWVVAELLPKGFILYILVIVAALRTQSSFVQEKGADNERLGALLSLSLAGRLIVAQFDWSLLFAEVGSVEKH